MPDLTTIAGLAGGLKSAYEITKTLHELKVTGDVQAKVIELQRIIMSAQSDALATQTEQFALLQRIRDLEEEVAKAKAWEAERKRYALQEFPSGAFAYVLRDEAANGEPIHRACANCYQQGHIAILQTISRVNGGERVSCQRCSTQLTLREQQSRAVVSRRTNWMA